ncbi:hypothetical protein SAY86_002256 [Trapa natans]|uniref:Uncharacterized protein n=1 Tax=Trapa natans TaxID=22666 RepID=A0AAN7R066_TRANT|nr:hypothetical protein SAY86_002256 [Trapa natans]
MAASSDREMEMLLNSFDQIYQEFKSGIEEIQLLKSNCQAETKRREALEISCVSLQQDNERLTKLYTNSMNNLADQLEQHLKCQRLEEEIKRVTSERMDFENDHRKTLEMLKQDYAAKFGEFEAQLRCLECEKQSDKATINHLSRELTTHRRHIESLTCRLEQAQFDLNSKSGQAEIQDLRDCLLLEQEEKNGLHKKLKDLEKECG